MRLERPKLLHAILLACFAVIFLPASAKADANVDEARLKAADTEPQNWFTLGRDSNQTYFSPLSTINAGNVDRLG
jgi:quinohemoprotein ethanol dehydrogenase